MKPDLVVASFWHWHNIESSVENGFSFVSTKVVLVCKGIRKSEVYYLRTVKKEYEQIVRAPFAFGTVKHDLYRICSLHFVLNLKRNGLSVSYNYTASFSCRFDCFGDSFSFKIFGDKCRAVTVAGADCRNDFYFFGFSRFK